MDDYYNTNGTDTTLLDNPNSNKNLSAVGMSETLAINFVVFVIVMMIFESNRFYKQIYLKRLQNRFQALGRVPAYPPEDTFGWLKEIRKISEMDLLRMVGLDAYMCLRYIVICFKFSCFLSFWGLLLLVPTYGTANDTPKWDRFAISNILAASDKNYRLRLWISALCGYMFAAYFCQLLYAEYNNFSVRRLQYLVQSDGDTGLSDPDTPPQKYYTVMIERIPSHLRSAQELHKFFEKLFPDDVYTVEIALDLSELDSKCKERKTIRDKLEKAIAHYEAKNERPNVRVYTGNYTQQGATNGGIFDGDSIFVFLNKALAWEQYGYEWVDAIAYYTQELQDLNEQVVKLQKENYERITKTDEKMLAKLKNKHDTRVAAVIENFTIHGAKTMQTVSGSVRASTASSASSSTNEDKEPAAGVLGKMRRVSLDSMFFGPGNKNARINIDTALDQELGRIEKEAEQLSAIKPKKPQTPHNLETVEEGEEDEEGVEEWEKDAELTRTHSGDAAEGGLVPRSARRHGSLNIPPPPPIKAESIMSSLHEEPLFKEMMENAGVDLEKEEEEANRRRIEYEQDVLNRQQELLRKGTEAELKAYVESAAMPNPNSIVNRRPVNPFSIKPFADLEEGGIGAVSRSRGGSQAGDYVSGSSSEEDEEVNKFDENDLKSSTAPKKNRVNDYIDNLGDMRKMSGSHDEGPGGPGIPVPHKRTSILDTLVDMTMLSHSGSHDDSGTGGVAVRRQSMMDTLGDMRKAHTHFQQADELGSSVHGTRRAVALKDPRVDEPMPPPTSDSVIAGGIASLGPTKPPVSSITNLFSSVGSSSSGSSSSSSAPVVSGGYTALQDHEADEDVEKGRGGTPTPGVTLAETNKTRPRKESGASISPSVSSSTLNKAGIASMNPLLGSNLLTDEQREKMAEMTRFSLQRAKTVSKEGLNQTVVATQGALRGAIEVERTLEMLLMGAYYKYSSTAFVTFKSRVTESIAYQMLLSHDTMEISHAPNPHDIIWDNVAIPKSQIKLRNYITNIAVTIGSIFWSSLVNSVNIFASWFPLPASFQQLTSAVVMLVFLLLLPFVFDFVARYYEGMKLESEIQNSIMTRYFYYQLINVYVTVGFSGSNLWFQIINTLQKPQSLVDIIGGRVPSVSIFFTNLIIVKIFTAIPLEMVRPWQLSTILLMGNCMDRRETTRRDLRTGAFYSWPMLYGWIYPQLMMVLMIMCVYSCITPLMMPFCVLFFAFAYLMYKYQLLYVYINDYQSGGFMWYAVFNRSLIALFFASIALLGYLSLQLGETIMAGPFFFLLPLPFCIAYFGHYCTQKFKKPSMNLSYGFARELDHRNAERRAAGKPTPQKTFIKTLYRQPSLTEKEVYPEPYRNDGTYDILRNMDGDTVLMADWKDFRTKRGSLSINVHELTDEGEEDQRVLVEYFREVVLPLSIVPDPNEASTNGGSSHHGNSSHGETTRHTRRSSGRSTHRDEQEEEEPEGGAENLRPFGRQRR